MKNLINIFCLVGLLGLSGCGGNHPLELFGDPDSIPELGIPITSSQFAGTVTQFSTSTQYMDLTPSIFSAQVISPAGGVVSEISGNTLIVIYHNARLVTRLSQLGAISVRPGDRLEQGSLVGTASTTGSAVRMEVFLDGVAICPYRFFNLDARQRTAGLANPCGTI